MFINRIHLHSLGEFRGGLPPLTGVPGGVPLIPPKTPLGRAGGKKDAHVAATTPAPPTRIVPCIHKALLLPREM